jgi:hypothetical protein
MSRSRHPVTTHPALSLLLTATVAAAACLESSGCTESSLTGGSTGQSSTGDTSATSTGDTGSSSSGGGSGSGNGGAATSSTTSTSTSTSTTTTSTSTGGGGGGAGGGSGSSCDPSAWIYMGNDANACVGHLGEPCGWTTDNEGQGYHCQTVSWGTGCEPG